MALDFPSSPVNGQTYDNFYYDSTIGAWRSLGSSSLPNALKNVTISTATGASVPITVQGFNSQSANLQEWKNSSGTTLSSVAADGTITTPNGTIFGTLSNVLKPASAAYSAIVARGATSQTADIQQWQDSSGTVLSKINTSGIYNTPNTPYFSATRSGDLTGYNPSNQSTVVIYNAVDKNIGNYYNSSTGKFTAPITGTYVFTVGMYQSQNVSQIWPVVNGSRQQSYVPSVATPNWATSGTQYLVAGDNIGFASWSDGGTNVTIYANGFHTFIRGTYIG